MAAVPTPPSSTATPAFFPSSSCPLRKSFSHGIECYRATYEGSCSFAGGGIEEVDVAAFFAPLVTTLDTHISVIQVLYDI